MDKEVEDLTGMIKDIKFLEPGPQYLLKSLEIKVHPDFSLTNINLAPFPNLKEVELIASSSKEPQILNLNEFDNLSNLKKLSINGIEIKEIIYSGCGLRALEKLELISTKLATFDLKILNCSRTLEKLNLTNNNLAEFGVNVNCFLPDVETIDLSHNNLSQFDTRVLSCSSQLKKLYLNGNKLESFKPIFDDGSCVTPKLRELNLADNSLKHVNLKQFSCAPKLSFVDLRNNQLMELDIEVTRTVFPALNNFFITNNSWTCANLNSIMGLSEGLVSFVPMTTTDMLCEMQEVNGICCNNEAEDMKYAETVLESVDEPLI